MPTRDFTLEFPLKYKTHFGKKGGSGASLFNLMMSGVSPDSILELFCGFTERYLVLSDEFTSIACASKFIYPYCKFCCGHLLRLLAWSWVIAVFGV